MRYWILFTFLGAAFLASGCASTKFFSQLNKDYPGVKYQRVLIQFSDIQQDYSVYGEKATQDAIGKAFGGQVQCYLYSQEFYTGLRSKAEIKAELQQFITSRNIDAILMCVSSRNLKRETDMVYNGKFWAPNNNDQKQAGYRMELIDVRAHRSVWYSTGDSEGSTYFNSYEGMMHSFIEKSVDDMKAHELLGPNHLLLPTGAPASPDSSI
jgi:hypothetical protein